jgi:hypothetical protein
MNIASANKKATYWERVRYDGSAQSSMYVVVDQGRLIMATTSLDLARQTFAKVREGLAIDGLVGEKPQVNLTGPDRANPEEGTATHQADANAQGDV